ncbi:MAG: ABC transporter substrate-binding protein [Betaproteobacteria bacterium]
MALGASALIPFASFGQQQVKVWRIGYLDPRSSSTSSEYYAGFVRGMSQLGYADGISVVIERRFADGNLERLQQLASELARMKVDVIVTDSTPAVRAAMKATATIPIVVAAVSDPVAAGLVKSLAHPAGNVTGLSNLAEELDGKRMQIIVEIVPKISSIALMASPEMSDSRVAMFQAAAAKLGRSMIVARVGNAADIDSAFSLMRQKRAGALVIYQNAFLSSHAANIAELALRQRIPTIGGRRQIADAGCMLSYGVDYVDMFKRAATYVDKIFKGANPGDIPIEQATRFELVINMKTAKALGLKIPQSILVQATKVIE